MSRAPETLFSANEAASHGLSNVQERCCRGSSKQSCSSPHTSSGASASYAASAFYVSTSASPSSRVSSCSANQAFTRIQGSMVPALRAQRGALPVNTGHRPVLRLRRGALRVRCFRICNYLNVTTQAAKNALERAQDGPVCVKPCL